MKGFERSVHHHLHGKSGFICRDAFLQSLACVYREKGDKSPHTNSASLLGAGRDFISFNNRYTHKDLYAFYSLKRSGSLFSERQVTV